MSRDRYERRHRATRPATIARDLAKTGPVESNDVDDPFVGATFAETRLDSGGSPTSERRDSSGFRYSGITHQAIVGGGAAETWCGEWAPGDRMTLFDSQNVTCPKCKSTSERKP